ncbi:MAG TPA: MFS transporter [Gemmatimonadales bacterium]|nr:MFS transporter [Gemmatimonadales bacterium]
MPARGLVKRAIEFLGLRRGIAGLLAMVVLVGAGEHLAEQFLPLYLLALGGGFLSVGVLNGMDNLLSALYSFPGGYLSDRLGAKRALLAFNGLAIAGFLLVVLIPTWAAALIGSVFFMSWSAISLPATMAVVARALPPDRRTMGVSLHSLVRRVPMAAGPIVGGAFVQAWGLERGIRLAFALAVVLALVGAALQQVLLEDHRPDPAARPDANPFRLWGSFSPGLKRLLLSDILVRFCEQIPYAFVVIWAVGTPAETGPVTPLQFGLLRSIEMATAVLVYLPVAYFADRGRKKPFVVATFAFFALFPLVLLFSHSFPMLVLAFVVRGLKEFGEPTRKALILDLVPQDRRAGGFGLYYLVRDLVVTVAAFGGAILWTISPRTNLLTAFGFGLLGTVWFALSTGLGSRPRRAPGP